MNLIKLATIFTKQAQITMVFSDSIRKALEDNQLAPGNFDLGYLEPVFNYYMEQGGKQSSFSVGLEITPKKQIIYHINPASNILNKALHKYISPLILKAIASVPVHSSGSYIANNWLNIG